MSANQLKESQTATPRASQRPWTQIGFAGVLVILSGLLSRFLSFDVDGKNLVWACNLASIWLFLCGLVLLASFFGWVPGRLLLGVIGGWFRHKQAK